MNLFAEIATTNRAYCHAHGLSAAELYGTAPNSAEVETSRLIAAGVPAESAGSFLDRMESDGMRIRKIVVRQQRAIRLRNRGYAPGRFANFAKRERWIRSQIGSKS